MKTIRFSITSGSMTYSVPVPDLESLAVVASAGAADVGGAASRASLTLGHVLTGIGADGDPAFELKDILIIRHTFNSSDPGSLRGPEDLTEERVLAYTREQKFAVAPRYWIILVADGGKRSRLWGAYVNHGDLEPTAMYNVFDLRRSDILASLEDRLVIEWDSPLNWRRRADSASASRMPVLEIADRDKVPFPGFDGVLLPYHQLCAMVDDPRYADWRVALSEVQGIYLITDSSNGKQYVGKADGVERILGRWTAYARDGHGGNVALRELALQSTASEGKSPASKTDHARHFVFSLLRVFGPSTPSSEVNTAESHYKAALMTRAFGLNRN